MSQPGNLRPTRPAGGCGPAAGLWALALWILLAVLGAQLAGWLADEARYQGIDPDYNAPRLVLAALFGLAVLLPSGLLARAWRTSPHRAVYRAWYLAGVYALLLAVIRLAGLTGSQLAAVLQIAATLMFLLMLWAANRRAGSLATVDSLPGALWSGLAAGLLLVLPWALWGALGSLLDTVLNLAAAGLFGWAAAVLLVRLVNDPASQALTGNQLGLAVLITLLVMTTGFGVGGLQWLLLLPIAGVSWLAARMLGQGASTAAAAVLLVLTAAGPMVWLDPEELALVINTSPGELLQYAVRAGLLSAGIGLLLGLFGGWVRLPARALAGLALGAAAALAVGYLAFGQPGLYGERLFVILKDQAQLNTGELPADPVERRVAVYDRLTRHARDTQQPLRQALDRFGIRSQPYYLVNGLEVWGGPLVRLFLESRPEVDRVLLNPELRPLPEPQQQSRGQAPAPTAPAWNLTLIGADRVWSEFGITGEGILVGQSDSGVQGDHPELADGFRGQDAPGWLDPWNHTPAPTDFGGHGTHTLGTILGNQTGVAPGASWIACVNLARNMANPAYYLDCLQFNFAPYADGADPLADGNPAVGAQVLNNSWGCPEVEGCDPTSLQPAVSALRAAGVFVVASAGNTGQFGCGTVSDPPAIYDEVFSVGSIDQAGQLSIFSSIGPVLSDGSGRVKPDLAAPGEGVLSAFPGSTYEITSGTSMAGPHVVGVVALMWSANPALIGDIATTEQILIDSARDYTGSLPACVEDSQRPNPAVGYGVLDAYAAVRQALALR